MHILACIVLGVLAGFIASKIVNRSGEGLVRDCLLGIVGALVGGWAMSFLHEPGVSGLNVYSLAVAVVGAILVLIVFHAIRRAV